MKAIKIVSVPSRGAIFLNYFADELAEEVEAFPSPLGELYFLIVWDEVVAVGAAVQGAVLTDEIKGVALLDIDYSFSDKNVMLRGVTTSAEAKNALLKELARKGYAVMDCLELLPDVKGLEGRTCRTEDYNE